jgi:hypothetical protein
LLQTSASAISSQASRVAELDERKLRLEEARIEREGEIEARRIKVEEDERHGYSATRIGKRKWRDCELRLRKPRPN